MDELYRKLLRKCVSGNMKEEFADFNAGKYDPHHLDCLLNPYRYPPVLRKNNCDCPEDEKSACEKSCGYDAISRDKQGNIDIDKEKCAGCGECIERCKAGNLTERRELYPVFELLRKGDAPVFALIAPAFHSQFSEKVTAGKLRSAFKKLGFAGMIEVALFADILTLKEALEFDRLIHKNEDFLLTSCCCPLWIAMIRKVYNRFVPHIPPSVSPMVASGRSVKLLHPEAKTVFIGPCIAKKAEAREPDIADAVDSVLTFQEIRDIFQEAGIRPEEMPEDIRDHSSTAGRIYARTGGVSEAVLSTLKRLKPERGIQVRPRQADGVPACRALLNEIQEKVPDANFIEGMGCRGGCVGGPRVLIPREEGARHVDRYGGEAVYKTPADNPFVLEMLDKLGFHTVENLLHKETIFTRRFE